MVCLSSFLASEKTIFEGWPFHIFRISMELELLILPRSTHIELILLDLVDIREAKMIGKKQIFRSSENGSDITAGKLFRLLVNNHHLIKILDLASRIL